MKTLATYETGKGKTFDLTETLEKQNKELCKALENLSYVATLSDDIAYTQANVEAKRVLKRTETTFENLVINSVGPKDEKVIPKKEKELLHALKYMVETFKPHMAKMKISKNFSEFNAMAAAEKAIYNAQLTPAQQFVAKVNEEQPGTFPDIDGGKDITDYSNQSGGEVIVK